VAAKRAKVVKLVILIGVVILLGVAVLLYSFERRKPKPLILSGSLEARTVTVGSLYGGRVRQIFIDEGSQVVRDQVIVTLETVTVDRQIAEQNAAIAGAAAQLQKALAGSRAEEIAQGEIAAEHDRREMQRFAALFHQGVVSKEEYDGKTTQARTSAQQLALLRKGSRPEDIATQRAQLQEQQARLGSLQKQRDESRVVSSVAGVVQSFTLRPGDLVAPNQGVAEILESDQLWVRVYLPETLLGVVHQGLPVRVFVDTYPHRPFAGRIAQISNQGEYTPRNVQTQEQRAEQVYAIKVVVDPNPVLKAGMAATVDLGLEARQP
jgi:HlyD family secretion protein